MQAMCVHCLVLLYQTATTLYVHLTEELVTKLEMAKIEITKRSEAYAEKQKELISTKLLESMDEASLGEVRDNAWLHKQVMVYYYSLTGKLSSEIAQIFKSSMKLKLLVYMLHLHYFDACKQSMKFFSMNYHFLSTLLTPSSS